jgi:hypothetical protein
MQENEEAIDLIIGECNYIKDVSLVTRVLIEYSIIKKLTPYSYESMKRADVCDKCL